MDLRTPARYKLLDHFRRTGAHPSAPLEDAGELVAAETAEEGVVRRDLSKLLNGLPERQSQLLQDVKITGFSMEEAAARAADARSTTSLRYFCSLGFAEPVQCAPAAKNQGRLKIHSTCPDKSA